MAEKQRQEEMQANTNRYIEYQNLCRKLMNPHLKQQHAKKPESYRSISSSVKLKEEILQRKREQARQM
jgi:hypothetical protein